MTRKHLTVAGWLAMANAALTVPWVVLTFIIVGKEGRMVKVAENLFLVVGTGLYVYLLVTLRRFLAEKCAFHEADTIVMLLITANVVSVTVGVLGSAFPGLEDSLTNLGIIMVVVLGILQAIFGAKLLRVTDDLKGLHKPYCYLNILTGASTAMIVLLSIGVLSGAIADVMLGTIFFQAAADVEPAAVED
jgi:hypothetical protein